MKATAEPALDDSGNAGDERSQGLAPKPSRFRRDVFLTHASKDKSVAHRICSLLEARGASCWIAPRDVSPGEEWAEAIVDGIEQSRALLLVLSRNANRSPAVAGELEKAFSSGKPIFTVRIQNVTPSRGIELFIRRTQWIDAFSGNLEQHMDRLGDALRSLLDGEPAAVRSAETKMGRPGTRIIMAATVVAACILIMAMGAFLAFRRGRDNSDRNVTSSVAAPMDSAARKGVVAPMTTLVLEIRPPGTVVRVDGAEESARRLDLPAGNHLISVEKAGYRTHEETCSLKAGEPKVLDIELIPKKPNIMW